MCLEAPREMKLSKMSDTRKNWREKCHMDEVLIFYLEATRETKLSKMSVTRKNLAGKVSHR